MKKDQTKRDVEHGISPVYQPLQPTLAASEEAQRPLTARGEFSNAWVVYHADEMPEGMDGPTALANPEKSSANKSRK